MYTINIPQMQAMIAEIGVKMREPLMFWGPPGCGKSEGVQQSVRDHNGVLVDIRLSQYDSVDLRGIPVPHAGMTVWHAPITLPFKGNAQFDETGAPIFLFLDEINSAAPAVAAVAYQLINDRAVGEHTLMDNVIVIAAGNRDGDRGVTNRMPTPLANRFTHAEVDIDVDSWCYWAQQKGLPAAGIAFMQFRKPLLSTFDPAKPDKAFATPRTWCKALRYYDSSMPEDIKQAAMAGAIGKGPAAEFWGFIDVWSKMIPMSTIEKDPAKTKLPDEAAMRYAVAVAISGTLTLKNVPAFSIYLKRMDPEFAVLAWQLALKRDETLLGAKEFVAFSKDYRAIFAR
jgi:hypothetical protein